MRTSADRELRSPAERLRGRFEQRPKLARLLRSYLERYPGIVDDLRESWETGDLTRIRRIAHQLSGSAGTFGFPDVSDSARRCERLVATSAPLPAIEAELASLETLMLAASENAPGPE